MDFSIYNKLQLQAIASACYKQCDRWPTFQKLQVESSSTDHTWTYEVLLLSGDNKEKFALVSHRGKSPMLSVIKGRWHRKSSSSSLEEDLVQELYLKIDDIETELTVANVRCRTSWPENLSRTICSQLFAADPEVFKSILDSIDLDELLKQEQRQRDHAKKYQENKRSRQFSLREQQIICRNVLRLIEDSLQPSLDQTIFATPLGKVFIRWSLPPDEYLSKLVSNKIVARSADTTGTHLVDISGEQLLLSIERVFNLPLQELLSKLFNSKVEVCRRFALQFGTEFTNSGLIDADPKVRLLARQKAGKK